MVLIRSAMLVRSFYPTEILARLGVNEAELWDRYNVQEGDWIALAAIFLGEIFDPAVLNPLTETDTRVRLETKEANLSRYCAMLSQSELDSGGMGEPCEWPLRSLLPTSQAAQLPDLSCFSPLARDAAVHSSPPWKKKRTHQQQSASTAAGRFFTGDGWEADEKMKNKSSAGPGFSFGRDPSNSASVSGSYPAGWHCQLLVPLPIPHPILICLLIYNRHRDVGAIPLESDACRIFIRYLEGSRLPGQPTSSGGSISARPAVMLAAAASSAGRPGMASRSPASHKPLLGSSGSDLALSHPSLANDFSSEDNSPSAGGDGVSSQMSPSHGAGHDTLVSIAQDGTLSLVGTLQSEHASVIDVELAMDPPEATAASQSTTVNTPGTSQSHSQSKATGGLGTTLARAADTLRAAFLGEKAGEDQPLHSLLSVSSARNYSTENFELLPSGDDHDALDRHQDASLSEAAHSDASASHRNAKKFPTYQPATFKSWRMNLPPPLRYDQPPDPAVSSRGAPASLSAGPTSPRPLGLFELSSGLAQDRGPAFSPAQLAIGRRLMETGGRGGGAMTASSSQDSLPFAEEDASLVDSPDPWPEASSSARTGIVVMPSSSSRRHGSAAQSSSRSASLGQPYCEMQVPSRPSAAVLASIEDLSVSLDTGPLQQRTHVDLTSKMGTQV